MARPDKNHLIQKEELVRLSLDLFLENGYENTTISQIMKAANLSKGGLYHYFANKEEILDHAIVKGLQQDFAMFHEHLLQQPLEEQLFFFIINDIMPSEIARKLLQYSFKNKNSYAAYRIREYRLHMSIPVLEEIFNRCIATGFYTMENPAQMAEMCILLFKACTETNFLPPADDVGTKKRLQTFIQLVKNNIQAPDEHWQRLQEICEDALLYYGKEVNG